MSNIDPVKLLLEKIHNSSDVIAEAYYQGRIHKTEDNARDIERLRQIRLLSPDIRDAFQLRSSFRQFLNATLSTERLFSMGANIGAYFQRLLQLVEEHSIAYQESRDSDCERYEYEVREAISDIADAIDDELIILQAQVETRFAAVSTIAEKKRQNLHYQQRTKMLVELLENFHFSDISEQLQGHDDLALSFKSLLADRIPAFRDSLLSILSVLGQYLFEFRNIEQNTMRIRAFALHLSRNVDWEPKNWDEILDTPEWLKNAATLGLKSHPDVDDSSAEKLLGEIAESIATVAGLRTRNNLPAGVIEESSGNKKIPTFIPPIRKAVHAYFKAATKSKEGISARDWWASNPIMLKNIQEDTWLLRVLTEHDNKGDANNWAVRMVARRDLVFNGNLLISDVVVSGKPV